MAIADAYVDLHVNGENIPEEVKESVKRSGPVADKEADRVGRSAGRKMGLGMASGLQKTTRVLARSIVPSFAAVGVASAGIVAASAVPQILSLTASLAPLAGALGVLPGLMAGAAAGISTLVVGFKGFGDALKKMGDPKKFAAALKNLAPNAREAVLAIKDLGPAYKELRLDVQNRLFKDLGKTISTLGTTYLPVLQKGMGGMASEFNKMFISLGQVLSSRAVTGDVGAIFQNSAAAVLPFTVALRSLIPAFTEIGKVASTFLEPLTAGFAKAATTVGAFIERASQSGALADWIQGGLTAFGQLWQVLKGLGGIIWGIVKASQAAGGGALAGLATSLTSISDVVNGEAFQTGLTNFFSGIMKGASGVLSALPAIGKFFATLGTVLGDAVQSLGPLLGQALTTVAGALTRLAPFFGTIVKTLGPALVSIVEKVANAVATLGPTLADVAGVIGPLLATGVGVVVDVFKQLIPIVGTVVKALGPVLTQVFAALGKILPPIAQALGPIVSMLAGALGPVIASLVPALEVVGAKFKELLDKAIRPLLAMLLPVLVPVLKFVANILLQSVASAINGIINVVQGVMTVLKGVINFVKAIFTGNWSAAWDAVKQIFSGLWQAIIGIVETALNIGVFGVIKRGFLVIKSLFTGNLGAIKAVFSTAWEWIVNLLKTGWDNFVGIFAGGGMRIKGIVTSYLNGIKTIFTTVFNWIRAFITTYLTIYKNIFTAGFNAVKWIVTTAFNLMKNTISSVWSTVKTLLKAGWDWIRAKVFDPIKTGVDLVRAAFTKAKDGIKTAWDALQGIASKPIKFIIQTVLNNGLISGFNWLSSKIGGPQIGKIPVPAGMKTGGVLSGYTPGRDVHHFTSPTGGRLSLSGGEAIMRPEWTRAVGGPRAVAAMNSAARRGQAFARGGVFSPNGAAFADGGVLGWIKKQAGSALNWVTDKAGSIYRAVTNPARYLASKLPHIDTSKTVGEYGKAAVTKGVEVAVAKIKGLWSSFKKAFDESGGQGNSARTISEMMAVIHRILPDTRLTSGLRPGAITALGNVSQHAKGLAVDLVPHSVERFDKILKAFPNAYQAFYSPSDGKTLLNGRPWRMDAVTKANHWDHMHLSNKRFHVGGVFDNGGVLRPGWNAVNNKTGRDELLTPVRGSGGGDTYNVRVDLSIDDLSRMGTVAEFVDMLKGARVRRRQTERSGTVNA